MIQFTQMPDPSPRQEKESQAGVLALLVEALKRYGAVKIILFGSAARGDADAESDLDVIAVVPTSKPFISRLAEVVTYLPTGFPQVDILVYTPSEYSVMLDQEHPFLTRALAEGRMLYEA